MATKLFHPNVVTIGKMARRRRVGNPVANAVLSGSVMIPELRYGGSVVSPIGNGGSSVSDSELTWSNHECQLLSR